MRDWYNSYLVAKDYFETYGHLIPVCTLRYKNKNLGRWVVIQRHEYSKGRLSPERIELLNALNMVWNLKEFKWFKNYYKLKDHYDKYHNLNVPELYSWINFQKQKYNQNKLSSKYQDLLKEISVDFQMSSHYSWDNFYDLACQYYEENHHLKMPVKYTMAGKNVGNWLRNQRKFYKVGKLSSEKIEKLEKIKMVWDVNDNNLKIGLEHAQKYYEKYGNLAVLGDYCCADGFKLGCWIKAQRRNYTKNTISNDLKSKLNNMGMIWDYPSYYKELHFIYAKQFYEENGHLLIPRYYSIEDINIGKWLNLMRTKYQKGLLTPEEIERLEQLNIVWDVPKYRFLNNKIDTPLKLLNRQKKIIEMIQEILAEYPNQTSVSHLKEEINQKLLKKL